MATVAQRRGTQTRLIQTDVGYGPHIEIKRDTVKSKSITTVGIGGGMHTELANCTGHLLGEIADTRFKRRDVSQSYRLAMDSTETTDWGRVNGAIIARWSVSALEYIKRLAWSGRCFSAEKPLDTTPSGGRDATNHRDP